MPWCRSYSTCTQPAGLQTPTWQKTGSPLISAIGQRSQTDSFGRLGDRKAELDEGRRGRKTEAVAFFCDFSVQLSTCVSRNKEVKHTHLDVTVTPEDCPLRVKRFSSCVCVCVCAFGGCSLCFWKRPRRRVSIQATKLYRLLSPLTKTGTKMPIISCFTFWNNTTVSPGKINKGASCILKVFRGGKWMTCSKCTDRLMWCSYPLWSYTSPSRRRRGCCTERRRPPHLRQSERLIFTKHLTRCCRL